MGIEIERKFLVTGDEWRALGRPVLYRQGYLCLEPGRTVRVRTAAGGGYLSVKGPTAGLARAEYDYEIPLKDAEELLETLCLRPLIEKYRYTFEVAGVTWEVDEFLGGNAGLVVAEVELDRGDREVPIPPWVGREVSDDRRYTNASLVRHPFSEWS